ncbi:MAG: geranylgeranyl reductase family protein [Litoreibacter sp.]|uniref:geranylgeranyl reductase family protein n=1 Tax=Litoreibacter sp. TaxID=1969459 RepID=UPI003297FD37
MSEYDIIVVGSGPAGSAAATTAAKAGYSVAVVDKAVFPRNKLCGGLFTGRSQKAMRRIFGQEVTQDLFVTTDHMRLLSKGRVLADIPGAPPVHLTMRRDFDAMLHGEAIKAGAIPYLGHPISELGENALTLRDGTQLAFKVLIGADGVSSFVAKTLFGRSFNPDTIGFALEIETPRTPAKDNAVEIDLDAASWGYGWSFPKHKSVTVGVGGINARNANMKANMTAYVRQTDSDEELRFKGQYLPFGDYRKKPGRGNILLAGDAAGLVDPVTGEGIALAMESGSYAAEAAIKALQNKRPQTAYVHYSKLVKPIQRSIDQAKIWRMIMFPKATKGYFRKALERGSSMQAKYLDLLAGEAEYADLRGALLRRIPNLGWRFIKHRLGFKGPA